MSTRGSGVRRRRIIQGDDAGGGAGGQEAPKRHGGVVIAFLAEEFNVPGDGKVTTKCSIDGGILVKGIEVALDGVIEIGVGQLTNGSVGSRDGERAVKWEGGANATIGFGIGEPAVWDIVAGAGEGRDVVIAFLHVVG